jgi:hypothetical protein
MHYVTRRSHRMQKHKFGVTCSGALFVILYQSHLSMKNSASMFHAADAPECTMRPVDPTGRKKHKFHIKCLGELFVISVPVSPEHGK